MKKFSLNHFQNSISHKSSLFSSTYLGPFIFADILDFKNIFDRLGDEFLNHDSLKPQVAANVEDVPHPQKVHNFARGLNVGQVSAVSTNQNDQPVIFHRGPVVWNQ